MSEKRCVCSRLNLQCCGAPAWQPWRTGVGPGPHCLTIVPAWVQDRNALRTGAGTHHVAYMADK
eukprot:12881266-Prorocentrum_lima.AAC.1